MRRLEAYATDTVLSRRTCEADKTLLGEGERGGCQNPGEVLYGGALLCVPHATLLGLEDRAEAVLHRVFRMDEWLEGKGSVSSDEEFVGRVRHERAEAVAVLRLVREQIRNSLMAISR